MAVTGDDLRGNRLRLQPHFSADILLHKGIDVGKSADRTGDGTGGDVLAGSPEAGTVAVHLGIEGGQLEAEGDRLCVDAVGAPHADRVLVLVGTDLDGFQQGIDISQQFVSGLNHLHRQAGIQNV